MIGIFIVVVIVLLLLLLFLLLLLIFFQKDKGDIPIIILTKVVGKNIRVQNESDAYPMFLIITVLVALVLLLIILITTSSPLSFSLLSS